MSKRLALIVGSGLYRDETLSRLISPDADVGALADTLLDPEMGGFDDVKLLVNMVSYTVRKEISNFFSRKTRTDLLLLYFSGHGVLDDRGQLYLAVKDTDTKLLRGTAIPARYITEEMDNSHSQRQVLILDCCHSGAFARGTKGSPGSSVGTASTFEGTGFGRVVLTASDATQYAWEGNQVIGDAENSLFTHFLIQGIQTGKADTNQDGQITVDEIYDYAYTQILKQTPKQTPGKWSFKEQGELIIARAPFTRQAPEPLPERPYVDEEQEQQLQKLYTDGLSAYWLENWDRACQNFAAILEIRPGYLDVETKLEEANRRKNYEELYQQAVSKYEAGNLAESISLLETLISQVPDYKDAKQRFEKIRNEKKLADLVAEANQLFNSGKHQAVIKIFESIQELAPDFVDVEGLLEKAKVEVAEIERTAKLEDLYRRAILELDAGRLKEAKLLFLQLQSEEQGFRDTKKLLERVDGLIVREAERTLETQKPKKEKLPTDKKKFSDRVAGIPKFVRILVVLIGAAGLLFGAYLLLVPEPLSGKILIWHSLNDDQSYALEIAIENFIANNPDVSVEVEQYSFGDIRGEFENRADSGNGPDLIISEGNYGPLWYDAGLITDVNDLRISKIDEMAMEQGQVQGAQIGFPFDFQGVLMFRNRSIIAEQAASFLDLRRNAISAKTSYIRGALLETGLFYSAGHLYALGGSLITDEGDPAFNTAEGIAWLEMLQDFHTLGADDSYMVEDEDLFKEGKVGVIIDGTWNIKTFYDSLGEDLVIDPWPENMSGFVNPRMIYLSANCAQENLNAAKGFMVYILSEEAQNQLSEYDTAFIPTNTDVKITDSLRQQAMTALREGVPMIWALEFEAYWEPMQNAIRNFLNGQVTSNTALSVAEGTINSILTRMRSE